MGLMFINLVYCARLFLIVDKSVLIATYFCSPRMHISLTMVRVSLTKELDEASGTRAGHRACVSLATRLDEVNSEGQPQISWELTQAVALEFSKCFPTPIVCFCVSYSKSTAKTSPNVNPSWVPESFGQQTRLLVGH